MTATDMPAASAGRSYEDIRKAWTAAKLQPLWENPLAHKRPRRRPAAAALVVERGPAAGRRRHEGHDARRRRAARADLHRSRSARRSGQHLHQSHHGAADPVARRDRAAASPHHECAALRHRGQRRLDHRRRQGLPDGGRRPRHHAGLDLARACPPRRRADHLARCARCAAASLFRHRRVRAGPGPRCAGHRPTTRPSPFPISCRN